MSAEESNKIELLPVTVFIDFWWRRKVTHNIYKVFNIINKPNIYLRYADDILLTITLMKLIQETFQNSFLNFTQEININIKIPFLGVLIDTSNNDRFITSTYKKTNKH